MTILADKKTVEAEFAKQGDALFTLKEAQKGSIICPITVKHIALACSWLNDNWAPGKPLNFRELSKMSACRSGGGARDFTADGIPVGMKLSVGQLKEIVAMYEAEYNKRNPPAEVEEK